MLYCQLSLKILLVSRYCNGVLILMQLITLDKEWLKVCAILMMSVRWQLEVWWDPTDIVNIILIDRRKWSNGQHDNFKSQILHLNFSSFLIFKIKRIKAMILLHFLMFCIHFCFNRRFGAILGFYTKVLFRKTSSMSIFLCCLFLEIFLPFYIFSP